MNILIYRGDILKYSVCDDDREIVDAIAIYLNNEGYTVYKAYNGLDALKILEEKEIHLIILDIMMPQMDGLMLRLRSFGVSLRRVYSPSFLYV